MIILASIIAVVAMVGLPFHINFMVLPPVFWLLQGNLRKAIGAALLSGLIAESFSPWRFGALTLSMVIGILLTYVMTRRFFSLPGFALPLATCALATALLSLPALASTRALGRGALAIAQTAAVGGAALAVTSRKTRPPNIFNVHGH